PDGRTYHIRGHTLFNDKQELVGLLEITREITAQKKADQLLRDSEEQYRSILESMEDSIHVVNEDLKIILQNPALTQWMKELGLDSNISGKDIRKAFPFISDETLEEYTKIFQSGEIHTSLEKTDISGREYYTAIRKIPIIRAGKTFQIITVIRNITEQHGAQIALQESESRYRLLYENLADGILVTNSTNVITFASDKAGFLFGYDPDELVGKGLVEFVHPDDTKWVIMAFRESLQKGGVNPVGLDVRGIKKDGTEFIFHISSAIISRNGKFEGYQLLISDVTERVNAVQTVLKEREKYRILFDAAPVAIGVATTSGKVIDVNKHMLDMLGYTRDEMKSLGASAIYSDSTERQKWLEKLQEEKHVRNFEVEYVTSEGKIIDILMNIDEVEFGQEGRVQLSTLRDITELNQTKRELIEASARAEFFNDLMAHDLNNIHQGVLMSLELILMSEGILPDARDKAEAAYEQIRKSIGLISSVRKLSNIELHSPELIETDVHLVTSEAIRLVKHAFPEKEPVIEITFNRQEIMVMADEFLIDAFYNLIHNSMKVSNEIPEIQITIESSETEGFINISISDKGPGISDDRKDMLFTRLDTGRTLGSGIGLTLVKRIMERYYGNVWIEDRIHGDYTEGAKIILQIPLSPDCYLSKK
ncbi:MAG: PAS domain-containing sensor histidine kinase, partial [Candidatus Thorarchaeota archaeon]